MNVASLELCKELYEVSGYWDGTFFDYNTSDGNIYPNSYHVEDIPAYDLSYLLNQLPGAMQPYDTPNWLSIQKLYHNVPGKYVASYIIMDGNIHPIGEFFANTPEDATAKLAIELFKQGILTKS